MKPDYKYVVIGAGPAGINLTNKLIGRCVSPDEICWIDPEFKVGAFGTKYADVPGNTEVKSYLPYLDALKETLKTLILQSRKNPQNIDSMEQLFVWYTFALNEFRALNEKSTPKLKVVSPLLQHASDALRQRVPNIATYVTKLEDEDSHFTATLANGQTITSDRVIFVPGAEAKEVDMPENIKVNFPLLAAETVFSQEGIQSLFDEETLKDSDTIAVIGSSHSAALAVMQLITAGLKVVWLKRDPLNPLVYAEKKSGPNGDRILYDNSGLKGEVAKWCKAREVNGIVTHDNLTIVESDEANLRKYSQCCARRVEAIGFKPSQPYIYRNNERVRIEYNEKNGLACDNRMLVGGIAFPPKVDDHAGRAELGGPLFVGAVGLSKFVTHEIPEEFIVNKSAPSCLRARL